MLISRRIFERHAPLLLILALFTAGVLAHSAALPLIEGSDEDLHYLYVERLRATGMMPDRSTAFTNPTKQVSGHPPLTYAVAALVANLLNLPRLDDPTTLYARLGVERNPWNTPGNIWNRFDNHNFYYVTAAPDASLEHALRTLRLASLVWGWIAIAGAYSAARAVFRERRWGVAATAVFAFTPTFLHSAAYLNNDISATALATLALAAALRYLASPASVNKSALGRAFVIGVLVALAGLAKVSALLIAPACALALVLQTRRSTWLRSARVLVAFTIPIAILFGAWMLWGAINYDDPLGFNTHNRPGFFYNPPLTLGQIAPLLPNVYLSYWARFGLSVYFDPLTYTLYGIMVVLSGAGYAGYLRRQRRITLPAIVLLIAALALFAGLVRWMQTLPAIPGRLLLPVHLAYAIAVAGGLRLLAKRIPRLDALLRFAAVGLTAGAGLLAALVATYGAYTTTMCTDETCPIPATLQGAPRDFDGAIRFLGYTQASDQLQSEAHAVTTCWQVLQLPSREPAYTLKIIGDDGILTDRTTLFGLGLYPRARWHIGDRWCETLELPLAGHDLPPGQAYNLVLALLDAHTFASDWMTTTPEGAPFDTAFVAQVFSPPES